MKCVHRIIASVAVLFLSSSGIAAFAPTASAVVSDCHHQRVVGSGGHHGAKVWCNGGNQGDAFDSWVKCRNLGSGEYTHYGPRVFKGQTSTVWCSLGDAFVTAGARPK